MRKSWEKVRRTIVAGLVAAASAAPSWAGAQEVEEPEAPPKPGRVSVTVDGVGAGGVATTGLAITSIGRLRLEKAVAPTFSVWGAPQLRLLVSGLLSTETVAAGELAAGTRWFPGGRAPEGFNLGAYASVGRGSYTYKSASLFGSETETEDGSGFTWSAGGSLGWEWITKGGFCFGLRLEAVGGTVSIRENGHGVMVGLGYSLGGIL
ncbi:MAG TPA: hypothetical protein VGD74_04510 [Vulgatibacter sp.]